MGNILKYVFDKFGCKHEAYDKKDIDDKIKSINTNITDLQKKDTELTTNIDKKQNKVLSGTSAPSNSLGQNGDIYLQY